MEYEQRGLTEIDLEYRLQSLDQVQAGRYARLSGEALEIAHDGLRRYFRGCDRMEVAADGSAIREIIDDALTGRRVFTCGGGPYETHAT